MLASDRAREGTAKKGQDRVACKKREICERSLRTAPPLTRGSFACSTPRAVDFSQPELARLPCFPACVLTLFALARSQLESGGCIDIRFVLIACFAWQAQLKFESDEWPVDEKAEMKVKGRKEEDVSCMKACLDVAWLANCRCHVL